MREPHTISQAVGLMDIGVLDVDLVIGPVWERREKVGVCFAGRQPEGLPLPEPDGSGCVSCGSSG
jgi:hypothetical protein